LHEEVPLVRAPVPRATFIALRARREAYRIAADIMHGRAIDVRAIECPACHSAIEPAPEAFQVATCHACGQRVALPSHLRLKPRRALSAAEIEAAAEDERLRACAEAEAACQERFRWWLLIVAGAVALIVMFHAIYVFSPRVQVPSAF
jgi:hypothetical protein